LSAAVVEVLLSTFNGERYVAELLDSVLRQDYPALRVTVRDDGSSDGTLGVLRGCVDPRLRVMDGVHAGIPSAYFTLLDHAAEEAQFCALADQDDVWKSHKISRAVAALSALPSSEPALYCARVVVVDDELVPLRLHRLPRRGPSFANALVENIATGCTIVLNRAAVDTVQRRWPREVPVHDWWLYTVISGIGTVVYDPEPVVAYRQHGSNAIGLARTSIGRASRRVQRHLLGDARQPTIQARELRRIFGSALKTSARQQLDAFLDAQSSGWKRVRYAIAGDAHRQSIFDDALYRLLFAAGRV
jgi:glycosyltransferase involved in cell wall biosynthesis